MRRRRNLEGLRRALEYRETVVDDDGEWDLGVHVRTEAAEALRDFDPPEVAEDIARALGDPQPAVRLAAIETVATFETPVAVEALAACVVGRDESAEEGSTRSLELLEALALEGSAERVVERLLRPESPPVDERHHVAVDRLVAADPRGDDARGGVADMIVAALQDPMGDTPDERAERILERLGQPVIDVVLEAVSDGKGSPALLRTVGRLGDARAVEPIVRGLGSADPEMRRSAAVAAGDLNHTRAVLGLLGATQDPERAVRNAATVSLNQMGTAAVIAAMATFMQLGMEDQLLSGGQVIPDTDFLPADRDALSAGGEWDVAEPDAADVAQQPRSTGRRRSGGIVERLFGKLE
jgi:HEAT repeat protein